MKIVTGILFILFLLTAPSGAWAGDLDNNACILCHSDYWDDMRGSIHSRHLISCDQCHGGNPLAEDMEEAKAPGTGYIGIPEKTEIAEKCGTCHADVGYMNFYNLPTDQLARYKTSAHGKLLFEKGDDNAAVCTDCHGYHDILSVKDPANPVYPLNLPETCNQCHGKEKLMSKYGHPADILETYKDSVHGKALYEKNDLSAANCAKCHGSHGAVPPGVKDVGNTCGKCHVNEKKYFLESPHARISEGGGFSECVSCHGYHGVQRPDSRAYEKTCGACHADDSAAFGQGRSIAGMIRTSEEELAKARVLVKKASIDGIFVEAQEAELERAQTNVIGMAPAQHSLSPEDISGLYEDTLAITGNVKQEIENKRKGLRLRKLALIPLWIFVLMMMNALRIKYNMLKKKEGDGHE